MPRTRVIILALWAALAATPALATNWTGAGANTSWATGGNWQGGVAPANGATGNVSFTSGTAPLASSVPVLWKLGTMSLQTRNWAFTGEDIWFTGNASLAKSGGGTPTFAQKMYIDIGATLTVNNADAFTLPPLWGYGPLIKQGAGTLTLSEIYTISSVSVQAGTLAVTSLVSDNDLQVAAGATVNTPYAYWGNLSGAGTITGGGGVGFRQDADTTFSGTISVSAPFSKDLGGTLILTGNLAWPSAAVYGGRLQVGDGISGMWPNNTSVVGQPGGTVTFNLPGGANVRAFKNLAVEVVAGAISHVRAPGFEFNTTQPVTITGGTLTTTQVQRMGAVTVTAPGTWTTGFAAVSSLSGNGPIVANGELQTGHDDSASTYSGTVTGTGSLSKVGAGILTLTGSIQTPGQVLVASGELHLQGAAITPSVYLVTGGSTLTGSGTIGSTLLVEGGAFIKPTMISAQGLVSDGTLSIAIEGTVPGAQHGQLVLATAPTLSQTALALTGSYVPGPGQSFTIVRNDSGVPVNGTFEGLAQGATILFNGAPLRINYAGGDGNDVTLAYATYAVTSSSSGNGSITPNTTQTLPYGAQPQFTLAPAANYHVAGVSGTCPGSLAGNIFTASPIVNDCTVIADFAIDSHSVTPSVIGGNGTITPDTPQAVAHGSTRQFTLAPTTGYHASMGGSCPAGSLVGNTYTTGAIVADCTVTVSFVINQYTVTPGVIGSNGTISPTGAQTVNHGATQQFTVTPATGYSAVVGGSCPAGSLVGTIYTTGAITGDCSVSASFTLNTYTVTPALVGSNGTILPDTPQSAGHGTTLQFAVTPSTGYTAVVGGNCPAGSLVGTTYTTGAIVASCTVSASFTINQYTVTPSAGAGGTIALATPQTVNHGATVQFTVTPDAGHTAVIGGTCPAGTLTGTTYTTGAITASCTVDATFPVNQYTVTPSAGANGTISPATPQGVGHGSTLQFTVTPAAGHKATMGGTCPAGTLVGNLYTTGAIVGDCAVSATFDIAFVNYTLVLEGWQEVGPYVMTSATGNGTATYNPVTKQLAFNFAFTFIGETGAHVHGPALRGQNAPALFSLAPGSPKSDVVTLTPDQETMLLAGQLYVNLQTFGQPDGELRAQVDALGATVLHTLTVTPPAAPGIIQGGTEAGNNRIHCEPNCSLQVPHGQAVELSGISGADGYVAQWGGDCSGTDRGDRCEFTMDGDKTVSATFVSIGVDLSGTLTATPNPAAIGQDVTFTTSVHNAGPDVATAANVYIDLPAGIDFVSASVGCTYYDDDGDRYVFCNAGDLAVSKTRQFTIVLRPTAAGTFSISSDTGWDGPDYNAGNEGQTVDLVVNAVVTRLSNISTRMRVGTGNDVLIGGFIIGGASSKRVAIVATGPSLTQYGITNALAHPTLTLVRQSDQAVIAANDGWQNGGNAAQLSAAGFAPSNVLESAILIDLAPGAYTAIVSGAGGSTGVGIVAVYEVDHPEDPLVNISTRGQVLTGNDVMIGGFVINGTAAKTLAIVATGPSLAQYGITNALANPTLTLVRSSDQSVVASNDDWQSAGNAATLQSLGFSPSNPLESAILITLPPGAYTAILSGAGGGTGVGVIGVYATD